eukprot:tig00000215_g18577.t1
MSRPPRRDDRPRIIGAPAASAQDRLGRVRSRCRPTSVDRGWSHNSPAPVPGPLARPGETTEYGPRVRLALRDGPRACALWAPYSEFGGRARPSLRPARPDGARPRRRPANFDQEHGVPGPRAFRCGPGPRPRHRPLPRPATPNLAFNPACASRCGTARGRLALRALYSEFRGRRPRATFAAAHPVPNGVRPRPRPANFDQEHGSREHFAVRLPASAQRCGSEPRATLAAAHTVPDGARPHLRPANFDQAHGSRERIAARPPASARRSSFSASPATSRRSLRGSQTVPRLAFSDDPEFDASHAFLAVLVPVYVIRVTGQSRGSICVAIHSKDDYSGLEATGVNLADLGITQEEWGTLHSRLGDVPTVLHALRAFGPTGARQLELFEFHTLAYPLGVPLVFPAASFDDDAAWRVTHELLPWEFAAGLAGAGMIHAWLHDSEKQKFSKTFGTGLQPWKGRSPPGHAQQTSASHADINASHISLGRASPGRKGRSLYARPARGSTRLRKPAADVINVDAGADAPAPAEPDAPASGSAPGASSSRRTPRPATKARPASGGEAEEEDEGAGTAAPHGSAKPASSAEEEAPEEPAPRPAKPAKRKRRPGEESEDDSDPDPEPKVVAAAPKRRSATKEIVRLPPPLTESERLAAIQRSREEAQAAAGAKPLAAAARHLLAVLPPPSATPAAQPAPHYAPHAATQPARRRPATGRAPFVPPADPWAATRAALLAGNGPPDLVWLAQHAAAAASPATGTWAPQAGFQLAAPTPAIAAGTAPAQTGPPAGAAAAGDAQNQRDHRESRRDRAKDRPAGKDRRKSSPATKSAGSKRARSASRPRAGRGEAGKAVGRGADWPPPADLVRPANLVGLQLPAAETGLHTAATELAERLRQIEQGFTNYLMPGGNNIAGSAAGAVDRQVAPMIANFGLFCIRETLEFCWALVTQGLAQANVQNAIGLVARIGEIRARMPGGACGRNGELLREWDALTRPLYHRLREAVRALSVLRAYMRPSADLTRSLNQAGQAVAAWPDSAKLLRSSSGRGTSSFLQNPPLGPHELRKFDKQATATLAVGTPEAMTAAFLAAGGSERRERRERGGRKHGRGAKQLRARAADDEEPKDRGDSDEDRPKKGKKPKGGKRGKD